MRTSQKRNREGDRHLECNDKKNWAEIHFEKHLCISKHLHLISLLYYTCHTSSLSVLFSFTLNSTTRGSRSVNPIPPSYSLLEGIRALPVLATSTVEVLSPFSHQKRCVICNTSPSIQSDKV